MNMYSHHWVAGCCNDPDCKSVHFEFYDEQNNLLCAAVIEFDELKYVIAQHEQIKLCFSGQGGTA